jgi:hypothetical protein
MGQDWRPGPLPTLPDISEAKLLTANPAGITTLEWASPEWKSNETSPARWLALYALGAGKGGSLYRIARERHAWSYRQDAFLWPTFAGWRARLFVPMALADGAADRAKTIADELLTDIATWDEVARARALGMAQANLVRGVPFGPVLLGDFTLGRTQSDRALWGTYWQMKTGRPWTEGALLGQMDGVTVEDLKSAAVEIVKSAELRILPGQ